MYKVIFTISILNQQTFETNCSNFNECGYDYRDSTEIHANRHLLNYTFENVKLGKVLIEDQLIAMSIPYDKSSTCMELHTTELTHFRVSPDGSTSTKIFSTEKQAMVPLADLIGAGNKGNLIPYVAKIAQELLPMDWNTQINILKQKSVQPSHLSDPVKPIKQDRQPEPKLINNPLKEDDITSIGWLHNHDRSICLTIAIRKESQPIFVTISEEEFQSAGGSYGLNERKQIAIDFYDKYGSGRP